MSFFEKADYKIPSTSNYMKLIEGKNKFRIISSAVTGFEYWNIKNKPVRNAENFEDMPEDIKLDANGNPTKVKHFWAFLVWNFNDKRAQILELTQKSVMDAMKTYIDDPDWGDPSKFDFTITRKGSGLDTEYQVAVSPHSPIPAEAKNAPRVDLTKLFSSDDPFKV